MTKQAGEPQWRTSSYTERQDCVELAGLDSDSIGIRDNKNHRAAPVRDTSEPGEPHRPHQG
ncbi:DUF397 domain-containing protein [Actinomadura napierensis]|uniref:DUF397 domain-containing protein n=1 Tax=Actinomadura napierensis TaxID=267854 RepID=UPI00387E7B7A